MKHTAPFLPAFGSLLFGRKPKSEQAKALEKLKATNTLGDLKAVCTDSIPDELLSPTAEGEFSRQRQYSLPFLFPAPKNAGQKLPPSHKTPEIHGPHPQKKPPRQKSKKKSQDALKLAPFSSDT